MSKVSFYGEVISKSLVINRFKMLLIIYPYTLSYCQNREIR